ncbi:hypothetical protein LEMLEM_LOCUS12744 [Lemmus lemmus]
MRRLCLKSTIYQEHNVEPDSANITVPDPHLATQVCFKLLEMTDLRNQPPSVLHLQENEFFQQQMNLDEEWSLSPVSEEVSLYTSCQLTAGTQSCEALSQGPN